MERTAMGRAYIASVDLEHQFWDMVYTLEGWKA